MSKDYLDKWEERAKKNTEIIEQTKTKMMSKEINIVWWGKDDWYFIPTFNLHKEYRCFSFYFLKFTLELAY